MENAAQNTSNSSTRFFWIIGAVAVVALIVWYYIKQRRIAQSTANARAGKEARRQARQADPIGNVEQTEPTN